MAIEMTYPPVPSPLAGLLARHIENLSTPGGPPPILMLGGNYRGIFDQLQHPRLLAGTSEFDDVGVEHVRVLRIGTSPGTAPPGMPAEVANELGVLASSAAELYGAAQSSLWFSLFASSLRIGKNLYERHRGSRPGLPTSPAQQLGDLVHDIAAEGPTVLLVDSIDRGSQDLLFNLAVYERERTASPSLLVVFGADRAGHVEDLPASLAAGVASQLDSDSVLWIRVPSLDAPRVQRWIGQAPSSLVDTLLAYSHQQDRRAAEIWATWREDGYVVRRGDAWTVTTEVDPVEDQIRRVLTARLADQPGLPANSMSRARRVLEIAAVGGTGFSLTAVANVAAEFEGVGAEAVEDLLDYLVDSDASGEGLLTEDGFVTDESGATHWRYLFLDSAVANCCRASSEVPEGVVAEALLLESQRLGFPPLFDGFHLEVAARTSRPELAAQFRERTHLMAHTAAVVDAAYTAVLTHDVVPWATDRLIEMAVDLVLLGYDLLAQGVAAIADQQARSTGTTVLMARAARALGLALRYYDPDTATNHYQRSLTLSEQLHTTDPNDHNWTRDLATTLSELALTIHDRDPDTATNHYQRSLTLHEQLHTTDPTNHTWTRSLAITLRELASTIRDRDPDTATNHLQRSLTLHEQLHTTDPNNHNWTRDLAITLSELASTIRDRDPDTATNHYQRSLTLHEQLHTTDPTNHTWTRDLAIALSRLAEHLEETDPARAAVLLARAQDLGA